MLTANSQHPSPITHHPSPATQTYHLRKVHDSLYWLNDWRLPYPVYRFQTGDIDGDGREDAIVGVVKSTRFYPEKGRRLFIFKLVESEKKTMVVRPLWLGSRLGGRLQDFRYIADGYLRCLESTDNGRWVVAEYRWGRFGMTFDHYLVKGTDKKTALKHFNQ